MYNTADYQEGIDFSRRPILRYRIKKEKDIPKLLGILYYVVDKEGNQWYFNPKKNPYHKEWFIKKPKNGFEMYEWRWLRCNESDFENAYNANPFPDLPVKVSLQFTLTFD